MQKITPLKSMLKCKMAKKYSKTNDELAVKKKYYAIPGSYYTCSKLPS